MTTRVKVDLSFTRNLGNYESIKIGVGVEDDLRSGENVDTATERVYKFVEDKLIEKTREVEEELNIKFPYTITNEESEDFKRVLGQFSSQKFEDFFTQLGVGPRASVHGESTLLLYIPSPASDVTCSHVLIC